MVFLVQPGEFNAIDLALDAVFRFRDMPCHYYDDWLGIAAEEAEHFQLVQTYLAKLGYAYGDFPAHNGLWDMACATAHDVLALIERARATVEEASGIRLVPEVRIIGRKT